MCKFASYDVVAGNCITSRGPCIARANKMMAASGIGRCQMLVAVGSTNVSWRSLIDSQSLIPSRWATVGNYFGGYGTHKACPTTAGVFCISATTAGQGCTQNARNAVSRSEPQPYESKKGRLVPLAF